MWVLPPPWVVSVHRFCVFGTVQVQLFSPRKGELADLVLQEMMAMLKTQFDTENKDLTASVCENYTDIDPNIAVLILCINASRLGSDVESALKGISGRLCFFLLFFLLFFFFFFFFCFVLFFS